MSETRSTTSSDTSSDNIPNERPQTTILETKEDMERHVMNHYLKESLYVAINDHEMRLICCIFAARACAKMLADTFTGPKESSLERLVIGRI